MGLDLVELAMAIEEEFGVEIRDADAQELRTPAAVIEYVIDQIPHGVAAPCASLRAFNLLRAALIRRSGVQRSAVRPETLLSDLFTKGEVAKHVSELKIDLDARSWTHSPWPFRPKRVRDLLPFAATSNQVKWTRNGVARLMRRLVIDQLGLKEHEYREDGEFIRDFGAG